VSYGLKNGDKVDKVGWAGRMVFKKGLEPGQIKMARYQVSGYRQSLLVCREHRLKSKETTRQLTGLASEFSFFFFLCLPSLLVDQTIRRRSHYESEQGLGKRRIDLRERERRKH